MRRCSPVTTTLRRCTTTDEARQESLSYEEYLESLVSREMELRHGNLTDRWLRQSRLPLEKSLQTFDQSRLSAKDRRVVKSLLDSQFLDHAENVLAFGNPGIGKMRLLCAAAQELVYRGHRVLFQSWNLLVQDLLAAKQELSLGKALESLHRYEAIIELDLPGYRLEAARTKKEVATNKI